MKRTKKVKTVLTQANSADKRNSLKENDFSVFRIAHIKILLILLIKEIIRLKFIADHRRSCAYYSAVKSTILEHFEFIEIIVCHADVLKFSIVFVYLVAS